jgi:hypothetical protein
MEQSSGKYIFPRSANYLLPVLVVLIGGGMVYMPTLIALNNSPKTTDVGYQPTQPVPFSHAVHAGQLGIDCRYCHSTVEKAPFAALPPTQVCMNCHAGIRPDSPRLQAVRDSWSKGMPISWVKVHDLPDYAFFNHSAHVNKGVGCVECHGRVDRMEVVRQVQPLSMSWCLDCHREPEKFLRPRSEVTNMMWQPPGGDATTSGAQLKKEYGIRDSQYMTSCSTCHR